MVQPTQASNFEMDTGYYVGNSTSGHVISGLSFQPDLVIIKANNSITQTTTFKTSAMATNATVSMGAVADSATSDITFLTNGFSLGNVANVNGSNIIYNWIAFGGSDCSATGTFCVGGWTGNGGGAQSITSVGFQPDMVMVKQQHSAVNFRTSSMTTNTTMFFNSTADNTSGSYISQFTPTGFDIGTSNNVNGPLYYFIAFKNSATFNIGTYTGDGTDNRNISGVGFQPSFVTVKNATSTNANNRRAVMSTIQYHGDRSSFFGDAVADISNSIQALQSDGFQVGSDVSVNQSSTTMYWFAFGGAPTSLPPGSGTYTMATGSYTGTGSAQSVTGLAFQPDLVIIKASTNTAGVFRTSLMAGDVTAYLAVAGSEFTLGITSLNSDGFSLGTAALVNSSGVVYHWQAFGNAYNPETRTGAADFAIGGYVGSGVDNRNLAVIPFQLDMITIKQNGNVTGTFRTSAAAGDLSSYFSATADASNLIQSFTSTGFQLGTDTTVNTSGSLYRWFGFKSSANFVVGSYTGTGVDDTAVTLGSGLQPDLVWVKRSTNNNFVHRSASLTGDISQFYTQVANANNRIQSFTSTGMLVGTNAEVNASGGIYRYAVWRVPLDGVLSADIVDSSGNTIGSPSHSMNSLGFPFNCTVATGKLGTSSQKIRVSNATGTPSWTLTIAATDGPGARWSNGGNTQHFDYNDTSGSPSGCGDSGDIDTSAGIFSINPTSGTVSPQSGCNATGISFGSMKSFEESVEDNITLALASSGADTHCYWDLTDIDITQTIPAGQPVDSYNLNFTITLVAT